MYNVWVFQHFMKPYPEPVNIILSHSCIVAQVRNVTSFSIISVLQFFRLSTGSGLTL